MTAEEIIERRWCGQGLRAMVGESPEAVVSKLLAMQGQDDLAVLWAVGARAGCIEAEVTAALQDGRLVRSWPMRGTLHLMASQDVRWMMALLAPSMLARMETRMAELQLDHHSIALAEKVLSRILAHGPVARPTLMAELEGAGVPVDRQRGYFTLTFLAHQGLICRGPRMGKQASFVLMDGWVPPSRPLDREEALARLALRYFQSHGPATVHDLAHWTALSLREARLAAHSAAAGLEHWRVGRTDLWGAKESSLEPVRGVRLLPGFDEYLLGYKDRSAILDPALATRVVPGNNGVFKPMMVEDGKVVGIWKRQLKARTVEVQFEPFAKSPDPKALRAEAEAYAQFLGLELRILP